VPAPTTRFAGPPDPATMNSRVALAAIALLGCHDAASAPVNAADYDLIFEGRLTSIPEILLLDNSTGQVRRLFAEGMTAMEPAPSPDGSRIAFVAPGENPQVSDLWVINRDGTGLIQLTNDGTIDDEPSWSPDGKRLAFRSYRTHHSMDIWVMNADGSNPVDITPTQFLFLTDESDPAWSPSGQRIAFASRSPGESPNIWVMTSSGAQAQPLSQGDIGESEPAWSPDGSKIAFCASHTGGADIIVSPSSGGAGQGFPIDGAQCAPRWTPDGQGIVFESQADSDAPIKLYSMLADGSAVHLLVGSEVPGGSRHPQFLKRR
jgi:Tol biopolymer transport system component